MDTLSFETARLLKESGFPQPDVVSDGEFWYSGRNLFYIEKWHRTGIAPERWFSAYPCFAPTATEILKALWFRFDLSFGGNGKWIVREMKSLNNPEGEIVAEHENPAEACAIAWMAKNKK